MEGTLARLPGHPPRSALFILVRGSIFMRAPRYGMTAKSKDAVGYDLNECGPVLSSGCVNDSARECGQKFSPLRDAFSR